MFNGALNGTGWHVCPRGLRQRVRGRVWCRVGAIHLLNLRHPKRQGSSVSRGAGQRGTEGPTNERENADLFWVLVGRARAATGVVLQVSTTMVRLPSGGAIHHLANRAGSAGANCCKATYTRQGAPEQLGRMMNLGYYQRAGGVHGLGMYCGPRDGATPPSSPCCKSPTPTTGGGQGGDVP